MPSIDGPRQERIKRFLFSVAALALFGTAAAALTSVPLPPPDRYDMPYARALPPSGGGNGVEVAGALPLPPVAAALLSPSDTIPALTREEIITTVIDEPEASQTDQPPPPQAKQAESAPKEDKAPPQTQPPSTEPTASTAPPTTTTTTTTPAFNVGGAERSFAGRINSLREAEGLGPLSWDSGAAAVARAWSEHMAATGKFAHNPNLSSQVPGGWSKLAENLVRDAPSVGAAHGALAGSAAHYANMVDPDFTHVGVGVALDAEGDIWATQVFVSR